MSSTTRPPTEARRCARPGCTREWRTIPQSQNRHCSANCEREAGIVRAAPERRRGRPGNPLFHKVVEETMHLPPKAVAALLVERGIRRLDGDLYTPLQVSVARSKVMERRKKQGGGSDAQATG